MLNWYGVGGEGKTALSHKLMERAPTASDDADSGAKPTIAAARVDLDDPRMRRMDEALLSIRLQLVGGFGPAFPCFDTAYARYFVLTNPGLDIRQAHPELFKGENPIINDLLGLAESGVSAVAESVPGVNLLYRYATRASLRVEEWFQRRGKTVLKGLDDLTPDQLDPGPTPAQVANLSRC